MHSTDKAPEDIPVPLNARQHPALLVVYLLN